ncbi:MAG: hypothetical protein MAG451_00215 [Anaerolineales bacterium]|nr:hypothetical protein [Anaerolineales bacterium]
MKRTVSFEHNLAPSSMMRVRFEKERGQITSFMVQLECLFGDERHPVVRYDTAHDFAHLDVMRPDGTAEKTALPISSYNEALTFAYEDIKANWQTYRERYQRWME